jgi:hypothetical protein
MSNDGFLRIGKNLFFVHIKQIEGDIVGVGLDGAGEEIDSERHLSLLHELDGETEFSRQNKDLYNLFFDYELTVHFEKLKDLIVREHDF